MRPGTCCAWRRPRRPSEHPLARAIVAAAEDRGLQVPPAGNFRAATAVGVRATVEGREVQVGGPALLAQHSAEPLRASAPWSEDGATVLHVLIDGKVAGAVALADEIREESRQAIDALHQAGIRVVMITGDAEPVARTVAADLGIDQVFAQVRPEDKSDKVLEPAAPGPHRGHGGGWRQRRPGVGPGRRGDRHRRGHRRGHWLGRGHPGLGRPTFGPVGHPPSRAAYRKMKQNLWWAAGYNIAAVPLAAGVLAPIGFILPMSVGAILMSLSTIVVALNAQALRRLDLSPEASTAAAHGAPKVPSAGGVEAPGRREDVVPAHHH